MDRFNCSWFLSKNDYFETGHFFDWKWPFLTQNESFETTFFANMLIFKVLRVDSQATGFENGFWNFSKSPCQPRMKNVLFEFIFESKSITDVQR